MKPFLPTLLLSLAAAASPAAPPASLYPSNQPLYVATPVYQATVLPAFAPTQVIRPAIAPVYAATPAPQGTPSVGAVLPAAPATTGAPAAGQAMVQPSSPAPVSAAVPAAATAMSYAPVTASQPQGGTFSSPASTVNPAAQTSNGPSAVTWAAPKAVPAPLPSDPWRRSQQVLNEISARERDGSLPATKAVALRAELEGLRSGSGLRRPSDGRHLNASERRSLMRKLNGEDAEVRRDASGS